MDQIPHLQSLPTEERLDEARGIIGGLFLNAWLDGKPEAADLRRALELLAGDEPD